MEFQKQTFKLMLAIITLVAIGYGVAAIHDDVTSQTRENLIETMFGDPMLDCMKTSFNIESLADEDDPKLIRFSRELNIYNALFIFIQIGILYLGSALIVRKFNKQRLDNVQ